MGEEGIGEDRPGKGGYGGEGCRGRLEGDMG